MIKHKNTATGITTPDLKLNCKALLTKTNLQ